MHLVPTDHQHYSVLLCSEMYKQYFHDQFKLHALPGIPFHCQEEMAKLINLIQIFKVLQNWVQLQYSLLTRRMNFTNRRMNFTKVKSIPGVQFFCGPPSQKLRASFGLTVACLEPVRGGGGHGCI